MGVNFCFDQQTSPGVLGYPNLAQPNLSGHEFDFTYPLTVPCRLFLYLRQLGITHGVFDVNAAPRHSWYPVALGWHDFDCDYFALMSPKVLQLLRERHIRALFYYHEGDHPGKIKKTFDERCQSHGLPTDCYLFVSANSLAHRLDNFWYFPDHHYFFSYVNRGQVAHCLDQQSRRHDFTVLSRTHKWWRATVLSDLYACGMLENSLWSYNPGCDIGDRFDDNPLELDTLNLRDQLHEFMQGAPYSCDDMSETDQNNHSVVNDKLYHDSFFHVVIETLFDADGSQGAFLTEKTFKCIKFGQPFIMVGTPGSLACLRQQGYRVFDDVIDNRYDQEYNNTRRWQMIRQAIQDLQAQGLEQCWRACHDDIQHNQMLFAKYHHRELHTLMERLACLS